MLHLGTSSLAEGSGPTHLPWSVQHVPSEQHGHHATCLQIDMTQATYPSEVSKR